LWGDFTDRDQKHLYLIGTLSAQAIVSAHLVADHREDLRAAQLIQQNLLPKVMPRIPGFDVAAAMVPAKMVGGDYFDFLSFSGGRPAFAVADVSGKGLPAALLMSNFQAIMRSQAVFSSSCCECVANVNRMLLNLPVPDGRFITLFLALLDPSSKELFFCNAGHNPPVLVRPDESFHKLSTGGRFLGVAGVSDEFPHEEGSVLLSEGDVLVIYSDGVTETLSETGEMFEEKRLLETVKPHRFHSAPEILSAVTESVRRFASKAPATDDLTLMVIKAL
ncbi:MAG: PP2C family protein-serine/threonine phosphatase, partial [Limisphaerales bacterium]